MHTVSDSRTRHARLALLLAVCTLGALALVTVPALGGGPAVADETAFDSVGTAPADDRSPVGPADNTTEYLVYFDRPDGTDRAPAHVTTESTLRNAASQSAAPLHDLAQRRSGLAVERQFWITPATLVRVDTDRVSLDRLRAVEGVRAVAPNREVRVVGAGGPDASEAGVIGARATGTTDGQNRTTSAVSTATHGASTWGLDRIDAPEAWSQYDTRGEGVRVAVLDTGVDADHPDIDLAGWASFDREGNRTGDAPQDYDPGGHGTHTAGTVTAGDGGGQHHGVAPDADLLAGAVMTDCSGNCSGTAAQFYAGLEWAVEQDADVASVSLGATGYWPGDIDPVRNAEAAGTMVVAASGNLGLGNSSSPANVFDATSVGAIDAANNVPDFSSGELVDTDEAWTINGTNYAPGDWPAEYVVPRLTAPGSSVNSTLPGGSYGHYWGTSMATPHVAGAAVLLESATDDDLSPAQLESALVETARAPSGADPRRYGNGVIDVDDAIGSVVASPEWSLSVDSVSAGVAGDPVEATVTVSNVGDAAGETTVTADLSGIGTASTSVEVGAGESQSVTLAVATEPDDDGDHTLTVTAGGVSRDRQVSLEVPPELTPDRVDVTNVGLEDGDTVAAFGNQTDAHAQIVPRDGNAVVVLRVETFSETDDPINGSVALSVPDLNASDSDDTAFHGQWLAPESAPTHALTDGGENLTLATGDDGVSVARLAVDRSGATLNLSGTARGGTGIRGELLATDAGDLTATTFLGATVVEPASLTGSVTNENQTALPNTTVWVERFGAFTLEPVDPLANLEDRAAVRQTEFALNDTATGESTTHTGAELEAFDFSDVDRISHPGTDNLSLLTFANDSTTDAHYTLEAVPATMEGLDLEGTAVRYVTGRNGSIQATNVTPSDTIERDIVIPGGDPNATGAAYQVSALSASPNPAAAGEPVTISANVTNVGDTAGTTDVVATVYGTPTITRTTENVHIDPGETLQAAFDIDSGELGGGLYAYNVRAREGRVNGTLTIEAAAEVDGWYATYTNDDGVVDRAGQIFDAIDAFEGGGLRAGQIFDLIESFESGRPVSEL